MTGKKASPETIKKLVDSHKGVPWSDKRRAACCVTQETKDKIAAKLTGRKRSEETKAKIGKSNAEAWASGNRKKKGDA